MRAQVVAILAPTRDSDGHLWYQLKFQNCPSLYNELRVHGGMVDLAGEPKIGDEIDFSASPSEAKMERSAESRAESLRTIKDAAAKARTMTPGRHES